MLLIFNFLIYREIKNDFPNGRKGTGPVGP
jgi:hypothetical protein